MRLLIITENLVRRRRHLRLQTVFLGSLLLRHLHVLHDRVHVNQLHMLGVARGDRRVLARACRHLLPHSVLVLLGLIDVELLMVMLLRYVLVILTPDDISLLSICHCLKLLNSKILNIISVKISFRLLLFHLISGLH